MKVKFIPPFKSTKLPTTELQFPVRILKEIETEGLLRDIEWDLDEGIPWTSVENREELAYIVPGVLKLVRGACEMGCYDAIIVLGGLDPGLYAAKEIGAQFGIPVVGTTHSSIIFASGLGHKYSVIDVLESMAINIRQNIMSYGLNERCASVRSIEMSITDVRTNLEGATDFFVRSCIEAIEKDGADVIVCGCTVTLLLQPYAQKKLKELGYDVPVLHGYKCAIEMARALVNMKVSQGQIAFPNKTPKSGTRVH